MSPHQVMMSTLRRALSLRRPHGSREEGQLLASLVVPALKDVTWVDGAGNLHVDLRTKRWHATLFVAHVDTVHREGGVNKFDSSTAFWRAIPGEQIPLVDRKGKPVLGKDGKQIMSRSNGHPLGADDGVGVAILAGLIAARKPGYYIFTRGEECGGIGSTYLAKEHPDLLIEFDRAIAFDRRDTFSVITHQMVGRCCSNEFAEAMAAALNDRGMLYMPDDGGTYTDTAEFIDIIPECTNLSAGYYREHSDEERLDITHVQDLFKAALDIDWDELPVVRDPEAPDEDETLTLDGGLDDWWNRPASVKTTTNEIEFEFKSAPDMNDPFYVDDDGSEWRDFMQRRLREMQ